MNNFDEIFKTEGAGINIDKSGLKAFKKKPKSRFKKRLMWGTLIGIVLYMLTSIVYFTIFLLSLL